MVRQTVRPVLAALCRIAIWIRAILDRAFEWSNRNPEQELYAEAKEAAQKRACRDCAIDLLESIKDGMSSIEATRLLVEAARHFRDGATEDLHTSTAYHIVEMAEECADVALLYKNPPVPGETAKAVQKLLSVLTEHRLAA